MGETTERSTPEGSVGSIWQTTCTTLKKGAEPDWDEAYALSELAQGRV